MWDTVTTWVSNTINNIVNWFKELPGRIWTWLTNTINNIVNWGKDMLNKGKTAAENLVNNVVDTIKKLPEDIFNIGKNIVQGLWNGINDMANWIKGKVSDFVGGIVDGVKGVLGIHSPSRVFENEIGKNMALGIGEGFDNNLTSIFKKMKNAVAFETQKLSANLSTTASMNKILTANITVNPADVYMDSTKVGRMVTPTVSRTIKAGGI